MKSLIQWGSLLLCALICVTTYAQQGKISRKDLLTVAIGQEISTVDIKEVTLSEGQTAPKHVHPCPVVGYVKSGQALFQIEGEETKILKEGDAFYEPKDKNIVHFDNASKTQPLTFVVFYLKKGNEEIIKILKE